MPACRRSAVVICVAAFAAGCASRSADVAPRPEDPAQFALWDCERIDAEADRVQRRAADVAYAVDERAGNNIIALGIGATVFWPALIAMRPDGVEAEELGRLRGRHRALQAAARERACPPPGAALPAARAAAIPLAPGERLVYEERRAARGPVRELTLRLVRAGRDGLEFAVDPPDGRRAAPWLQDLAGNVGAAPNGMLQWPHLLRHDLELGQVVGGEMGVADDATARARVRGQVVAVGPQSVAGRRFDVAVVELFGDAQRGESSTRLDGVIVVDRGSGVLLRLDLRCAQPDFSLQRRLARVEAAGAPN
jgi:hypothetical protein